MASSAKVFLFTCLLLHISMQQMWCASGSAIPIWEFLTRNEKMSYLYSTFAQLVSVHCKSTASTNLPVNQCKRNLLNYGSEKLQTFTEVELEALDPYQRGANELIWSSIMREHPSGATLLTTRKPVPTPPATSIVILTEQKPSSNRAEAESLDNAAAAGEHYYPKNPLFDNDAEHKHQYAMDMDIAYGYGEKPFNPTQVETFLPPPQKPVRPKAEKQQSFLTGPLVFRVRPDGTPVAEDLYKPLPRDDDLEAAYQYTEFAKQAREQSSAAAAGSSNRQRRIALQQVLQPPAARRYRHIDAYPSAFYYYPRA